MLAVEQYFAALGLGGADAVADRGEHFLLGRLERNAHVIIPGFGDKTNRVGLRVEKRDQTWIVRRRTARPPRHAEGSERRPKRPLLGKKAGVGRIGAGIAAFDIIDAKV